MSEGFEGSVEPADRAKSEAQRDRWIIARMGVSSGVALLILLLLPLNGNGAMPSIRILLVAGLLVGAVTSATLYLVVTKALGLPVRIGVYGGVFCFLLAVVKLVLGPLGYYQANQVVEFDDMFALSNGFSATMAAATIFVLYLCALVVLLRVVGRLYGVHRWVSPRRPKVRLSPIVVLLLVAGLLGFGPGMVLLIPLFFAGPYVSFVFGSAVAGLTVLSLVVAAALLCGVFAGAAERESAVERVGLLVSAFWVMLGFIALYHVLWVVWILLLTSAWPLRVVTTK